MSTGKPSLKEVKRQLREWETSRTMVLLHFLDFRTFSLSLFGRVSCGTNLRNFDLFTTDGPPASGHFSSPVLKAFKVVFLGPDPNSRDRTKIELKHRKSRTEMRLLEIRTPLTPEEMQAAQEASKKLPA